MFFWGVRKQLGPNSKSRKKHEYSGSGCAVFNRRISGGYHLRPTDGKSATTKPGIYSVSGLGNGRG